MRLTRSNSKSVILSYILYHPVFCDHQFHPAIHPSILSPCHPVVTKPHPALCPVILSTCGHQVSSCHLSCHPRIL
eukprot:scaffold112569_cov15-Tisochrysis_lutea.AAC.1